MEASSISRIYDLKSVGVQGVINDFDKVKGSVDAASASVTAFKGVTMSLQGAANSLGSNLSGATAGVVKMQAAVEGLTNAERISSEVTLNEAKARRENAKAILDEAKYTALLQAQKDKLDKARDKELAQLEKQQSAYVQLNNEYKEAAKVAQDLGAEYFRLEQREKELMEGIRVTGNAGGDTTQQTARLHLLGVEMENLGVRAKDAQAKALGLSQGLYSIEQATGRSQRNVGNYNSAVFAMSQILREAPSFAYSFSTGLMGISNNIPILIDEITKLKAANIALKESGQEAIPIWKTLSSALLSPVGLITVATAALTIFTARMTMAGNETKKATDRLQEYNNALEDLANFQANVFAGEQISKLAFETSMSVLRDKTASIEAQTKAYKDLQDIMPGLTRMYSMEDAALDKNQVAIRQKANYIIELTEGIKQNRAVYENELKTFKKLEEQYNTPDDPSNLTTAHLQEQKDLVNAYINTKNDLNRRRAEILKDQAELDKINAPDVKQKKERKGKTPHDYTNEILAAEKALTDAIAKERQLRLQLEMSEQKEIFDNTQLSLNERLKAYAIYATDRQRIERIANEAAIKDIQDKLDKIKEIESKPKDKRTVEENTLLINKAQLNKQLDVLAADIKVKSAALSKSINSDIAGIVKSDIDSQLKNIDSELSVKLTEITNKYNAGRQDIYESGRSQKYIDKRLSKTGEGEQVEIDEAKLKADAERISATRIEIQQAHNDKLIELENDLRDRLVKLYEQQAQDRKKYQVDVNKKDNQQVLQTLKDGAITIAQEFAQSYMQLLQQQDAYTAMQQQKALDYNFKVQQSLVQSNQERMNLEKQQQTAQAAQDKAEAEREKRRAQQSVMLSFAIASANNFAKNPVPLALANETILLAQLAIQQAMIAKAPAYKDGFNPIKNLAWVGDGGESELMKIGNSWSVSPNKPTLIDSTNLQSVTPFSQIGGQLKAPAYNSTSTSAVSDASISELYNIVGGMATALANQRVSLNTPALSRQQGIDRSKKVAL